MASALGTITCGTGGATYNTKIFLTSNGGATWEEGNTGIYGDVFSVSFLDSINGWSSGRQGLLMRTSDGGKNWIRVSRGTTEELHSVDAVDEDYCWAAGGGSIVRTIDGGVTWLETIQTGSPLLSIDFWDRNNGWVVGWDGQMKHSTDGGASWITPTPLTSKRLSAVKFVNSRIGSTVGDSGTFLRTTNGGGN
jgi:photosystem II stability/assembly factor-like uncharacterized protein